MANRKQVQLNFAMDDPEDLRVYDWYKNNSKNISTLMKKAISFYMEHRLLQEDTKMKYMLSQNQGEPVKQPSLQKEIEPPNQNKPVKKKRKLGGIPGV